MDPRIKEDIYIVEIQRLKKQIDWLHSKESQIIHERDTAYRDLASLQMNFQTFQYQFQAKEKLLNEEISQIKVCKDEEIFRLQQIIHRSTEQTARSQQQCVCREEDAKHSTTEDLKKVIEDKDRFIFDLKDSHARETEELKQEY